MFLDCSSLAAAIRIRIIYHKYDALGYCSCRRSASSTMGTSCSTCTWPSRTAMSATLRAAVSALAHAAHAMEDASTKILEDAAAMQHRTARAVSRTRDASDAIVAAVARSQAAVLSRARSHCHETVHKLLTEYSEEVDANARLLGAVASMRVVRQAGSFQCCSCAMWTRCRLPQCCVTMESVLC